VDPKYAYAYNYWGLALADQNKPEEAIDKYRKAIELDPENYYAYNYWGLALADQTSPEKPSRNLGKPPNSTLNMLKHMTAGAKYCECRESSMKPIKNFNKAAAVRGNLAAGQEISFISTR
jgi:tetratricopeptide (TPR) repeat protein